MFSSRFSQILTKYSVSSSISAIKPHLYPPQLILKDKTSLNNVRFLNFKPKDAKRVNFYSILGVPSNTNPAQVKKAFFELGCKFHPQRNKFDPIAMINFKMVAEAYEILSDQNKRRLYDAGKNLKEFDFKSQDPEELFRSTFGEYQSDQQEFKEFYSSTLNTGKYITSLCLSLKESANGVEKDIMIHDAIVVCPNCNGLKSKEESKLEACSQCNGSGFETSKSDAFYEQIKCSECDGAKLINKDPCTDCKGIGTIKKPHTFVLSIPPGIKNGQTVLEQFGPQAIQARISVLQNKDFKRVDGDIHSNVYISFAQAMGGGSVTVEGIYEDVTVQIPPNSSPGSIIKVDNKGIDDYFTNEKGNHYVHLQVTIPEDLGKEQMERLKTLAQTGQNKKKASSWAFWKQQKQ